MLTYDTTPTDTHLAYAGLSAMVLGTALILLAKRDFHHSPATGLFLLTAGAATATICGAINPLTRHHGMPITLPTAALSPVLFSPLLATQNAYQGFRLTSSSLIRALLTLGLLCGTAEILEQLLTNKAAPGDIICGLTIGAYFAHLGNKMMPYLIRNPTPNILAVKAEFILQLCVSTLSGASIALNGTLSTRLVIVGTSWVADKLPEMIAIKKLPASIFNKRCTVCKKLSYSLLFLLNLPLINTLLTIKTMHGVLQAARRENSKDKIKILAHIYQFRWVRAVVASNLIALILLLFANIATLTQLLYVPGTMASGKEAYTISSAPIDTTEFRIMLAITGVSITGIIALISDCALRSSLAELKDKNEAARHAFYCRDEEAREPIYAEIAAHAPTPAYTLASALDHSNSLMPRPLRYAMTQSVFGRSNDGPAKNPRHTVQMTPTAADPLLSSTDRQLPYTLSHAKSVGY